MPLGVDDANIALLLLLLLFKTGDKCNTEGMLRALLSLESGCAALRIMSLLLIRAIVWLPWSDIAYRIFTDEQIQIIETRITLATVNSEMVGLMLETPQDQL